MTSEPDAEHVIALALQPIGATVNRPHAVDLEHAPARKLDLQAQKTSPRNRPQVPHDLERALGVAEFHGGDVGEVVVPLIRIIVQPTHDLEQPLARDVDRSLSPYDIDETNRI